MLRKRQKKKEAELKPVNEDAKVDNAKADDKEKTVDPKKPAAPAWTNMLMMAAAAFAFFYFIILRPQKRDREKRQNVLDSMKKNDRVVTIGGIIGTVATISQDGSEVTLKLDDNARVKMLRSSISGPYKPAGENNDDTKS